MCPQMTPRQTSPRPMAARILAAPATLIPATLAVSLALSLPLQAEEAAKDDSFSLMEEGAKLLFRGLMKEMEPSLREMGAALDELRPELEAMGPKLQELLRLMGDAKNYDMPVMLENGDILIRRNADAPPRPPLPELPALPVPEVKPPAPGAPYSPMNPGPGGQIDL